MWRGEAREEDQVTMRCREVQHLLPGYSAEALSRQQMHRVREHLSGCAACSREWERLGATLRLVEELGPMAPPPGLWNGVYRRIEAGAVAGAHVARRNGRSSFDWRAWWTALFPPRADRVRPRRLPRFAPAVAALVALGAILWNLWETRPSSEALAPVARVPAAKIVSEPELLAAVQQHSLASAGQFFADRAGLETVVQLVRREGEQKVP